MINIQTPVSAQLDRAAWNEIYAERISERTDLDAEKAMQTADSADDAFDDGEDPVVAADEELTYWTN